MPKNLPPVFTAIINSDIDYLKSHPLELKETNSWGHTVLHHATIHRKNEVIQWLVDNREITDLDTGDIYGTPPIHYAAYLGNLDTVQLLKIAGANLFMRDSNGENRSGPF